MCTNDQCMTIAVLQKLFDRDLLRLKDEILAYKQEEKIWQIAGEIRNSGGNLCLHLVGNLKTYIGKELGGTPYARNRDLEFSTKNIPKQDLLEMIEDTRRTVIRALRDLSPGILEKDFPILVFETTTTTEYMLIHLATHLAYHLGQVNYHRRLTDN